MSWRRRQIGELCTVGRGSSPRPINDARYFEGGTIPWIKIADATASQRKIFKTKEYVNEFGASFSRRLPEGALIIATSGTLGFPMFLGVEGCIHDGWLYVYDFKGLDKEFFYYNLLTLQSYFHSKAYGAAIQNINTEILRETEINLPPIESQREIASILAPYDDLIENNRRRIKLLEESARLLYKEWFVYLRFPGHEHVKVVDGVPEGWEKKALSEICDDVRDSVTPDKIEAETPYIGLEHIPRRSITLGEWGKAGDVTSNKFKYQEGDILFGKIRPYFHKVGVTLTDGIASSDAIVIRPRAENHLPLTLMVASSDEFVAATSQAVREGSKMPRADWEFMGRYNVKIPSHPILEQFNEAINDILKQLKVLTFQNQKLTQARDLLLPRLMNGEIEV